MTQHDLEKLVHAFVFSRLDYCNGVFTGLCKKYVYYNSSRTLLPESSPKLGELTTSKCTGFLLHKGYTSKSYFLHTTHLMDWDQNTVRALRSSEGLLVIPRVRTTFAETAVFLMCFELLCVECLCEALWLPLCLNMCYTNKLTLNLEPWFRSPDTLTTINEPKINK